MRLLAAVLFFSFSGAVASGADKDEDKAKEVTVAFLKALKAKDLDAIMKTVDVPFLISEPLTGQDGLKVIEKEDDLKAALKTAFEKIKDTGKIMTDVGDVQSAAEIKKFFASQKDRNDETTKMIEKALGDNGYVVFLGKPGERRGGILVRVKDGKAKVVGVPK